MYEVDKKLTDFEIKKLSFEQSLTLHKKYREHSNTPEGCVCEHGFFEFKDNPEIFKDVLRDLVEDRYIG